MLDGNGKVRIMDFSLASTGPVTGIAGTPAYMAPEQLAGGHVTAKSDIYALGLVLYELFTGKRVFEAKTIADLVAEHSSGSITSPAALVKSLDQAIVSPVRFRRHRLDASGKVDVRHGRDRRPRHIELVDALETAHAGRAVG